MNTESVIIIGAGWAGLAAAVKLTQQGHKVSVYESAKHAGGRARGVSYIHNAKNNLAIDNGQHLLIGAYTECLNLIKTVGIDIEQSLKRLPLSLTVVDKPAGSHRLNKLILKAPALPAPLHLLYALFSAKGLKFNDRIAAIKFGLYLKKNNYQLFKDSSVFELFQNTKQTKTLIRQLWEPLCLATMNTPIETASARVFMRVFKDAFTHRRTDADVLIPTIDLSNLFPNAAINYIEERGGKVYVKSRVEKLEINNNQVTAVIVKNKNGEQQKRTVSKVIIATAPQNLNKIIAEHEALNSISHNIEQFKYEPIVTVYLQYSGNISLNQPLTGLSSTLSQWVFDRGVFCQQTGLVSVVISCNGNHMQLDDATLTKLVHNEIAILFTSKPTLLDSFIIREKRATFACTVNINDIRPKNTTSIKGLFLAGDYTDTGYPATLEGAVRSGIAASQFIIST
jgi:squalene-associated FAD-dependent desaturase